jgi:cobalamin-dependent methionine synthase I
MTQQICKEFWIRDIAVHVTHLAIPACPNLEDQIQLCELLEPGRIGVELSEEFQLHPEQSTSAIIVHHPEAKYFNAN